MSLVLSGDGSVGPLSATEVGYLDGVTSAVQAQIDGKADKPGAWTAYTPSTVAGITVGNGTLSAKYARIGSVVHFRIRFTFGSTSSLSTSPTFSLPFPSVSSSTGISLGNAWVIDAGTTYPTPACAVVADSAAVVRAMRVNSTYVEAIDMSATIPWAWATGDIIDISGTYEAA